MCVTKNEDFLKLCKSRRIRLSQEGQQEPHVSITLLNTECALSQAVKVTKNCTFSSTEIRKQYHRKGRRVCLFAIFYPTMLSAGGAK